MHPAGPPYTFQTHFNIVHKHIYVFLKIPTWSKNMLLVSYFRHLLLLSKTESNKNVAPLFWHRKLWQYIESSGKSKWWITGNFCSQTFLGANLGWRYIRVWLWLLIIRQFFHKHDYKLQKLQIKSAALMKYEQWTVYRQGWCSAHVEHTGARAHALNP